MTTQIAPAPLNMFDLDRKDGQYLISWYGSCLAFGYYGSPRFCELTDNLIVNYGFTNGEIHKANEHIYYIITSQSKLEASLLSFFAAAVVAAKEVPSIWVDNEEGGEVTWDEAHAHVLAQQRVKHFMENIVKRDNFMLDLSKGAA